MELTVENIRNVFGQSKDIVFENIIINGNSSVSVTLIYIEGLIDKKLVNDDIIKPLVNEISMRKVKNTKELFNFMEHGGIYASSQKMRHSLGDVVSDVLNGYTALVFNDVKTAFTYNAKGFEKRSIEEPTGENVVKGAKDAFVETLRVNTSIVRRKIKTPRLVIDETIVGKQTHTSISVVYIDGITNKKIVDEVRKRLDNIEIDGVLATAFIEEYIIDNKYSPFPQVIATERSDRFCAGIIEGRVGIIVDGLPIAFFLPCGLDQFLQAPEDYSQNFIVSSVLRFLRYSLMIVTLFLPAFYISILTFHIEMIPTDLALSIQESRKGVPFPSFVEAFVMLIAFEILVEAGIRLPKAIGQAVSIVGALVVGEAAVTAKLVSPGIVVVIAITAISSFTMPNQDFSNALRLWRFILVIFSSIMGLFGIGIASLMLLYHLSKIEICGIPYLSPYVANEGKQMEDTLFRFPLSFHKKRPVYLKATNKKRQK